MDQEQFDAEMAKQLAIHEGMRLKPYRCTANKLTIGVGRNIEDVGITAEEALYLLRNDIVRTRYALEKAVPSYLRLSMPRRKALIDMCFNLGLSGLLKFKKFLAAIEAEDFNRAADEMLSSAWAGQVGQRAHTLAAMMREG